MITYLDSRLPDRFWEKIRLENGHWIWTGAVTSRGYGSFLFDGKVQSTHRVVFLAEGSIPEGHVPDHVCLVKRCCNPAPDHLELVTGLENTRRHFAQQTHCVHGHPLFGDNLRISNRGRRVCIECHKIACKDSRRRVAARRGLVDLDVAA